jgi:hypothetical protein
MIAPIEAKAARLETPELTNMAAAAAAANAQ